MSESRTGEESPGPFFGVDVLHVPGCSAMERPHLVDDSPKFKLVRGRRRSEQKAVQRSLELHFDILLHLVHAERMQRGREKICDAIFYAFSLSLRKTRPIPSPTPKAVFTNDRNQDHVVWFSPSAMAMAQG